MYVAGPLTQGDPMENALRAMAAGDRCKRAGLAPYVPHLSLFWDEACPDSYENWMLLDFEWLGACDVLLRLPGPSSGADREVALAEKMGITVYYDLDFMLEELGHAYVEVEA